MTGAGRRTLWLLGLLALAALLVAGAAQGQSVPAAPGEGEAAATPPVHADAAALDAALRDATGAFIALDLPAATAALDALEQHCRRLRLDPPGTHRSELVHFDQVYHVSLDEARKEAKAGRLNHAFDDFIWVLKACRNCHAVGRKQGWYPQMEAR